MIDRFSTDGGIHILVAEDSSTQAMSLQYLLEQQGYRVTVCENGRLALEAALRFKPTLVISDVVMPVMDGYGLCREFKKHPDLADVPVLLVTTLNDPEDVLRGLEAGADSFILKPYDDPFLINRIRFVLLHRQLRQTDRADMGVEISFKGRTHFITSDRLQILNLLLSTYEAAIQRNEELRRSEEELRDANAALSEANARLRDEVRQREAAEAEVRRLSRELLEASEARLERSEERYRQLLDVVPVAIYTTDSSGSIQEFNQAAVDLWGQVPAAGISGEAFYRNFGVCSGDGNVQGGGPDFVRLLNNGGAAKNAALAVTRPDGLRVEVLANTAPLVGRNGEAQGAIHSLLDVTELSHAQRQAETSRQLVQATLDALPVYVGVLDSSGVLLAVNRAWRNYVAAHPQLTDFASVGANYIERWRRGHACDRAQADAFENALRELMQGARASFRLDYWNPLEGRWFEVSASRFIVGETVRFVLVYEEVTERKRAEEKLKESSALLRIAGEVARIGGWAYYPAEEQLIWSDEVAEIHGMARGYSPRVDEAIDFYAPEWRPVITERFWRCVNDGAPFDDELEIITASGDRVWVRAIGTALIEGGVVARVQGAFQDISIRKLEEERVARIAERLTTTLESITDGFFTVDRDWRFTYVNREAEHILHRSRDQLLGNGLWNVFSDALGTAFEHQYRQAMEQGITTEFEAYYPPLNLWVEVHVYPSEEGLAIYFRDVSQRKEAELALRQSEENLRLAVTAGGLGTWRWDTSGDALSVSDETKRMFGLSPKARMTLGDFFDTVHPDDRQRVKELVHRAVAEQGRFQADFRLVLADGGVRWLAALGRAYVDEQNDSITIEGVNIDITDRKRAEQQLLDLNEQLEQRVDERTRELASAKQQAEAANEAKSAFLATMSHEIRTPMNGIVGMVDILAHSRLNDHQADAVKTIRESAFGLLHLIDDILDFSKIEAGKIDLESVSTSLSEIAERVCETLGPLADAKNVDIFLFTTPEGPDRIYADPVRLRQILFNLLGNAVKFSGGRAKRGRVELRVELAERDPLRVVIKVIDNGIGMSDDIQRNLFQSFRQGEISTTRRFGGSGLGLAICKRLVELMGGSISVESREWIGSTFKVELPFRAAPGESMLHLPDLHGVAYLLVQGATFNAPDLQAYLGGTGAETHIVDGDAAVGMLEGLAQDVVVVHDDRGPEARREWLSRFAAHPRVRHLLIATGRRRAARISGPNVVTIDGNSLRRQALLNAVAVAAGRASPEIGHQRPAEPVAEFERKTTSVAEARQQGQLILIAEDDATNQKVLLRQLELLGYAAEVASDGFEALRLWRKGGYALLLTDLHMPGLDGFGLVSAIRSEETAGTRLPIVALTANALRGEAARAKAAGFDEFMTKPVQLAALRDTLEQWLPTRRAMEDGSMQGDSTQIPVSEQPSLDVGVLIGMVGSEPAVLRELLGEYERSASSARAALEEALVADDLEQVGGIAHRLKSSSRSVGALPLGDMCAQLENASKVGDHGAAQQTVRSILPVIDEVLERVRSAIGQYG